MSSIQIDKMEVRFGALSVLKNLNLNVDSGEFVVLLGPSGCGKSTLLNAIAGLQETDDGRIMIGGRDVTFAEAKDRGIGMVFQSYALYPRMNVRNNLSFGLRMAKTPKAEIARRVERASKLLQIDSLLDRLPSQLSGGQRQRVAIGRALVRDVDVYLFDEPLSNLDAKLRAELRVELKRLHHELHSTIVYVTHDQVEAMSLADRVAVMHEGVIQQFDTPTAVYQHPANLFVAAFVGSPAMNFLPGVVQKTESSIVLKIDENTRVDLGRYDFDVVPEDGRSLVLGIRPEHLYVQARPETPDMQTLIFVGALMEPSGATTLLWGEIMGARVSVQIDSRIDFPLNEPRKLYFDPSEISLFDAESGARI